jgi:hypothetical protein
LVVVTDRTIIKTHMYFLTPTKVWRISEFTRAKKGQMGIYVQLKLWKGDRFIADQAITGIRPQRQAGRMAEFINERIAGNGASPPGNGVERRRNDTQPVGISGSSSAGETESEAPFVPHGTTCPDCFEEVQPQARVCRWCGYRWAPPSP